MDCKRYKNWLGEAALNALERQRQIELQAHLAMCSECRASLERERLLLATIDQGIDAGLEAELSPEFAARVRTRLREEAARPRPILARWIPATAACMAVLALLVVWLVLRPPGRRSSGLQNAQPIATRVPLPGPNPVAGETAGVQVHSNPSLEPIPPRPLSHVAGRPEPVRRIPPRGLHAESAQLEVLVEKDQRQGLARLFSAIREHRVDVNSLMSLPPGIERQEDGSVVPVPLEVSPLETAQLDSRSGWAEPGTPN